MLLIFLIISGIDLVDWMVEFSTPDEESERQVFGGMIPDFDNWKKDIEEKYSLK